MRAENEDLMGWLLSAVMGSARSPVKIVEPPGPRGVNLRDFMLLLLLPMMRMMMVISMMKIRVWLSG